MDEINTPKNPLGSTACWTAAARAYESTREQPLFYDPWAAALAGPDGTAWNDDRNPDSLAPMILRTRYFDDFLQRVTQEYALRQVVLMAAGLDTRAYRLT
jgi:methyltransferase (TIGR00027 family)